MEAIEPKFPPSTLMVPASSAAPAKRPIVWSCPFTSSRPSTLIPLPFQLPPPGREASSTHFTPVFSVPSVRMVKDVPFLTRIAFALGSAGFIVSSTPNCTV